MPLPILHTTTASDPATLVRLFHKTEDHWTQQIAEQTDLSAGSAFVNPALPNVHDANRVLGASLPEDLSPKAAVEEVQAHFREQGVKCWSWVMNPSAPAERVRPLVEHLTGIGFAPSAYDIMHLAHLPSVTALAPPDLKIIPARASFRHARDLAAENAAEWGEAQLVESAMLQLDDPHWDALLALQGGRAVASIGVLAVGEIGRIDAVFVSPTSRRQGIGRLMMSRALEICVRSVFKHVLLSCSPANTAAISLYKSFGFEKIGEFVGYFDPGAQRTRNTGS